MNEEKIDINKFLFELRESADIQYSIFTTGSCFRLYSIISTIFPEAKAWWSDRDNHCIIKIQDKFYDIGGEISKEYINNKGYYEIPQNQLGGYYLIKYRTGKAVTSITVEKYIGDENNK